jgi:hypothetical protein
MPDLSELMSELNEESLPSVDFDAPEAGSSPPSLGVGTYLFAFHMPKEKKDWFDIQKVNMNKNVKGAPEKVINFLRINYEPQAIGDKDGTLFAAPEDGTELPILKFQNASFYKNEKMLISFAGELLRAIGLRMTGAFVPAAVEEALSTVDGRVNFFAEVKWEAYFKSDGTRFSTSPNKRKGDLPWPKDQEGKFTLTVDNPTTGQKAFGKAIITRVKAVSNGQ